MKEKGSRTPLQVVLYILSDIPGRTLIFREKTWTRHQDCIKPASWLLSQVLWFWYCVISVSSAAYCL